MAGAIHLGAFIFLSLLLRSFGHSYLAQPASRNLLQHVEGNEDCPHCLQGGGPGNVMKRGGGVWPTRLAPKSHGLCGDPGQGKPNPPTLADEKYLRPGHVVSVYQPGEIAEFHIVVSTHHQGHYEFRICDKALDGNALNSAAEGQACLDQWVLHRAAPAADCVVNDARGDCQPIDPKHPERWYLPPAGSQTQTASANWTDSMAPTYPSATETHVMRYKIPEALRCTHCTLQWYWSSGNTCLYDGDYFDYFRSLSTLGWSVREWSPYVLESWANCGNTCCHSESSPGAGDGSFGEEFWNCADIAVVQEGEPITTTTTITTIVTTTTGITTTSTTTTTTTATSTATAGCADVWDQCGGNLHTGPTCCVSGNYCFSQSEWYSQCVPNTADANSNTHLADIQKHSSVASDGHDKKTSKKFQKFLGTAFIQDQVSLKLEASAHFEEL
eukprot:TRINITY_DN908_c0_g1_i4.p1 TRINITY_DN908_c0_g1~~TRINITY_DN908_c0_g1_i4.p1  ORF type:complete len:442 (-),score=78.17 TRINITY_DN908_c0_g1_i4:285-1610(-)